jgi:hypothetical protein
MEGNLDTISTNVESTSFAAGKVLKNALDDPFLDSLYFPSNEELGNPLITVEYPPHWGTPDLSLSARRESIAPRSVSFILRKDRADGLPRLFSVSLCHSGREPFRSIRGIFTATQHPAQELSAFPR